MDSRICFLLRSPLKGTSVIIAATASQKNGETGGPFDLVHE